MERLKSITIIFLLAVGLLASPAPAKPAGVLLQEGLYAEEIEGNLNAAIKIYEQVIAEAKKVQRTAAHATYRIGMCYLKKGEKANAAIQFSNLVSKFPDQKALIAKAQRQLAKLRPPTRVFEPQALDELIKSGKVPYFEVQLHDNTVLDLDSGEILALKEEWPDRFDVAWDNDGGGVLMKKAGSGVRFLALPSGGKQRWNDAICMARSDIDILRNSNTRGIWASRGKFAAVLTNEGNLAVIQIGEYDAEQGTIYGWVEKIPAWVRSFGPVMERVINDNGEEKHWLIDFETGRLFSPSTETRSEEVFLRWIAENRIDAMGETRTSSPGLYGFDMEAIPIAAKTWETISPKGLADALSIAKSGIRTVMSAMGKLPVTYIFKTREGGMGVVQILEMQYKKKPRYFRIRYKMLKEQAQKPAITNARSVAEAFLAATVSGRDSEAIRLVKPGSAVVRQVKDFRQILEPEKLKIVSVYTDERIAVVTTTEISVEDQKGLMLIRLIKQRGIWMVEDIDLETPASLKAELDSFLQKHPNATKLQVPKVRGLSVSPHRRLLDERTLIAINNQDRFGAKWFKVEREYEAASQSKKQQMIEKWMADAKNPDIHIRSKAIASLGNINAKQAADLLMEIAKEPLEFSRSNRPRWIAVRSLGRVGDMRAVPVLIDLLDHYNKDTQLYARVALCEITGVYFGSDKTKWRNWWQQKLPDIETLIKEMHEPEEQRFAALNKLIKIGAPAVEPLISELQKSNNWQVPKALGAIGDKRAVEPLIKKWQKCDWSPMKEVISEALERITGKKLGQDKQKWDKWWQETKRFISPEATIQSFMAAAMKLNMNGAMVCVAGDSHDYKDIKAIFENPEHPFNILFRKIDPSVPVRIIETKIIDNMCEAVWQVTFKEDFTIEGKTFKAGETFDIDGSLHRYGDKWLITGI